MAKNEDKDTHICSFCGKKSPEAKKMLMGPHKDLCICDTCVISALEELANAKEFAPDEREHYMAMARQLRINLSGGRFRTV